MSWVLLKRTARKHFIIHLQTFLNCRKLFLELSDVDMAALNTFLF